MSEFYRYVWVRYKGKPYHARVISGMYGNYYELTYIHVDDISVKPFVKKTPLN